MRGAARRLPWAPAFVVVLLGSFYVLFAPHPEGSSAVPPGFDKAVHAGLFALLTLTARGAFGRARVLVPALLAYAVLSEVLQATALVARDGDWHDAVADAVGVALGWLLAGRLLGPGES